MASKTYHHRVPGATFVFPDGKIVSFAGGAFTTDVPELQKELDKVANVPSSFIYTLDTPIVGMEERVVKSEVMTAAVQQFDDANKIQGNPPTVEIPLPKPQPPVLKDLEAAKAAVAAATKPPEQKNK